MESPPQLVRLRPSASERELNCFASASLPQVIDIGGPASALGSAKHVFVAKFGVAGDLAVALEHVAPEFRAECTALPTDELDMEGGEFEVPVHYKFGVGIVDNEEPIDPENSLAGTIDFLRYDEGMKSLTIRDWKSGRREFTTPAAKNFQLRCYAILGVELMKSRGYDVREVHIEIGWLNDEPGPRFDSCHLPIEEFIEFRAKVRLALAARVEMASLPPEKKHYAEGPWCHFCPAWRSCHAKRDILELVASGYELELVGDFKSIDLSHVGEVYEKMKTVTKAMDSLKGQIGFIVRQVGEVPLPSGKTLKMVTKAGNEVLDPGITQGVVDRELGEKTMGVVEQKTTKTAVRAAVKAAKLPARRADEIFEKIREAGGAQKGRDSQYMREV